MWNVRPATCVEECEQCVQECVHASQWNRSHSDTCQRTFRHNETSLHVLNIDDAGDMQTLSPHICPSAFTLGHMSLDKSLDASNDLHPSVKALHYKSRHFETDIETHTHTHTNIGIPSDIIL